MNEIQEAVNHSVGHAFTHIVSVAFFFWSAVLARKLRKVDSARGEVVLVHSWLLRGFGLVLLFIPILGILLCHFKKPDDIWLSELSVLVFWVIGGIILLETFVLRITISEWGIISVSAWRRRRAFPWNEIVSVAYCPFNRWFIIEGPDRKKIRVYVYLVGILFLEDAIKKHVPWQLRVQAAEGFNQLHSGNLI